MFLQKCGVAIHAHPNHSLLLMASISSLVEEHGSYILKCVIRVLVMLVFLAGIMCGFSWFL